MKIDLTNNKILVTGANSGIGFSIANDLLKAGANVALHYNSNFNGIDKLLRDFPNQCKEFQSDFSNVDSIPKFFKSVIEYFGKLDILINNAGLVVMNPIDSDDEQWIKNWETIMKVNLLSTGILSKKAIEHFKQNQSGKIINIASRAAFRGDTPEYLAYAASKAGMVALSKSIARGFGKNGIKAFSIAPGYTKTAMAEKSIEKYGKEYVMTDIALNNLTEPEDISPIVTLICSGKFDHGTGSCIDINAGSYVR